MLVGIADSLSKNQEAWRKVEDLPLLRFVEQLLTRILDFIDPTAETSHGEEHGKNQGGQESDDIIDEIRGRSKAVLKQIVWNADPTTLFSVMLKLLGSYRFTSGDQKLISLISGMALMFGKVSQFYVIED